MRDSGSMGNGQDGAVAVAGDVCVAHLGPLRSRCLRRCSVRGSLAMRSRLPFACQPAARSVCGALSAAFQPAFQDARKQQDSPAPGKRTWWLTCLLFVVGLPDGAGDRVCAADGGRLGGGLCLSAGANRADGAATRIMMPFLLLVSLAGAGDGMLNAGATLCPPALAPALFNLATVVTGLSLSGRRHRQDAGSSGGVGGGDAMWGRCSGLQLVPLWKLAIAFDRRSSGPSSAADGAARDGSGDSGAGNDAGELIYVSSRFASTEPGAASWLYYAFRLLQLPIGMFGVDGRDGGAAAGSRCGQ